MKISKEDQNLSPLQAHIKQLKEVRQSISKEFERISNDLSRITSLIEQLENINQNKHENEKEIQEITE